SYADRVLGKLTADPLIDRAAAAIGRYSPEDRPRGVAFAVRQLMDRLSLRGVELSPALLRTLAKEPPEALLREGYDGLERDGPLPALLELFEELISGVRRSADAI